MTLTGWCIVSTTQASLRSTALWRYSGSEIVGADGYIDRKILGSKVFGKLEEMVKLTTAIGNIAEAVKEEVDEWNDTLGDDDVAVLEAVNLIEAGYGQWCGVVWLFVCDDDAARLTADGSQRLFSGRGRPAACKPARLAGSRSGIGSRVPQRWRHQRVRIGSECRIYRGRPPCERRTASSVQVLRLVGAANCRV